MVNDGVDEVFLTYHLGGYELYEVAEGNGFKEKGKLELGWYWLAFNQPRAGFWFIGPYSTKQGAEEDAKKWAIPMDDPRRENEIFDGVLPDAELKCALGNRGAAEGMLQDDLMKMWGYKKTKNGRHWEPPPDGMLGELKHLFKKLIGT